ncbi:hypothetical protein B5X24_HaOG200696 [Helicoverpa armigera]|uniref:Gustatory receptor n=1 Tax=Helicoverpa armigera TaxID=29058 RepID=A0A2W1BV25_HELAM|nr:hypothetical protein B5X24_HaOG200696 [Helicoverpa armigera]
MKMKIICNTIKKYFSKPVMKKLIDKDLQSMLLPINLMQNILLSPQYRIKDNLIKTNTLTAILVSFCGVMISIFAFLLRICLTSEAIKQYYSSLYIVSKIELVLYSTGFIINYISVLRSNKNVLFILKVQDIHRFVNDGIYLKRLIVCNWISVILIFSFDFTIIIYAWVKLELRFYNLICGVSVICFDINFIYAIIFLKLLRNQAELWNIRLKNFSGQSNGESVCRSMFEAYDNILKCYEMYKDYFQQNVCNFNHQRVIFVY